MPTEKAIEAARAIALDMRAASPFAQKGTEEDVREWNAARIATALDAFAEQARAQAIEEEAFRCFDHTRRDVQKAVAPWRAALDALAHRDNEGELLDWCWCTLDYAWDHDSHEDACMLARALFENETTENTNAKE